MRVIAIWCAVMVLCVGFAAAVQPTGTRSISSEPVYKGDEGVTAGESASPAGTKAISNEPVYNPKGISSEPVYKNGPDKPRGDSPRSQRPRK
jgi:hypothetical protein